ncbi:MAG TPA: SRPBCC domain-containing protein [Solirubrobacteraceae bacterium]|nr:SRPBCC domain-containing protein [Solirubrobacteraceae bacterium]
MSSREVATFRIERSFAAPPEDVFDAWTNPQVLERWWTVQSSQGSPRCEVDLRVGGRYVLRMRDDSGELHVVGGEYREVDRPRRLVYTWRWEGDGGPHPGHISIVTVEFRADGDLTTVVLEHSGLASEESRTRHGAGWQAVLERLAQLNLEQRDGA